MTTTDTSTTIVREIDIAAPAAKVFAALTEPEQLVQWWGDETTYHVTKMERDLRVGGKWRSTGIGTSGEPFAVEGEYREIDPPHVLVYTWRYDWGERGKLDETVVRFDLHERAGQTHLRVTHSGFADPTDKSNHDGGWIRVLGWLSQFVEQSR